MKHLLSRAWQMLISNLLLVIVNVAVSLLSTSSCRQLARVPSAWSNRIGSLKQGSLII